MARVLLLNPPVLGRPVLRDFACGESTKADYYWAPIDLLVLSGLLGDHHELCVIDAVVEELDADATLVRAAAFAPDAVFSLTAVVTLASDDRFLARLRERTGCRVYGLGDAASFEPVATLDRTAAFDGLIQNFGDPTLVRLAAGHTDGVTSVVLRGLAGAHDPRPVVLQTPLRYPCPRHELFPLARYRMPFSPWQGTTSVLTAYGCPFPCTFCPSRNLPGQLRDLDDVLDELAAIARLGLREFYLRDFTFGPTRKRARDLCDRIIAADLPLRWSAECRLDVLDEDLLDRMARAGCDVILVGVETGDEATARALGKTHRPDRTQALLAHARRLGIRACGHFVLGSPDETRAQIRRTLRYARALPLDYASFNLYAARLGTPMRDALAAAGRIDAADFGEQDVSQAAQSLAAVTAPELQRLFRWAVLSFYLRPGHALRLARVTPWSTLARQGRGVLRLLAGAGPR